MKILLPFILPVFLCLLSSTGRAQQTPVSGIVRDTKQTLPAASILLYTAQDSLLVSTALTDNQGKYMLNAKPGTYYLQCSAVGYHTVKTAAFPVSGTATQQPDIILAENTHQLNEVGITAAKPVIERKSDKLIFNVDATPSAAGLTGLELLTKAPGITVDHNENISLAGKTNVLVTIDGKQTYLSGAEVSNLLKSMSSSQIESIEIITNPGARYEANSTGGIINIKTKKSKAEGFNGNLSLGSGYNTYLQTNNNIDLNFRKKSYNVFGSYGYSQTKKSSHLDVDRVTPGIASPLYFSQLNKDTSTNNFHNFKAGTDFFLSPAHTLGFLVKGNISKLNQHTYSRVGIGQSFQSADSLLRTASYNTGNRKNFSYNINYKGTLDTAGQEISVDADYSTFSAKNNGNYTNRFFYPDGSFFKNGQIYRNLAPADIHIKAVKADYTLPLNKMLKLDAGLKAAGVSSDNIYIYENSTGSTWTADETKSNRFKYKEQVNAAYTNLSLTAGKMTLQAGLRAEHTHSTGNSVTTDLVTERKYTDLFPSLLLSRNFDADHILSLSYSRKVNRPNYQNLNPFIFYLDQYTYQQGNPDLKPEYSTNLEASFLLRKKYSVSVAYMHTADVISQVILQNELQHSLYITNRNLATQQMASLTLNFPLTLTSWWSMNNNIIAFYNQVKAPDLNGKSLNSEIFTSNFYMQNTLTLSRLISADASVGFCTPQLEGALKIKTLYNAEAGLRYNFPNKMGNLKLGISDVFHSQKVRVSSTLKGEIYELKQYGTTTAARLTFTYRFGKMTVKSARNRSTALEEEQKRLGAK